MITVNVVNNLKKQHKLDIKRVCSLTKKDTMTKSYHVLRYEDSKGYINKREFIA